MSLICYCSKSFTACLMLLLGTLILAQDVNQRLAQAVGPDKLAILRELCSARAETESLEVLAWGIQALTILETAPDLEVETEILLNMARAADNREENLVTRLYAQKALTLAEKTADLNRQSIAHQFLGNSYRRRDEYAPALQHFEKGLNLSRQTPNERVQAEILNCIGAVHYRKGETARAKSYFSDALEVSTRLGLDKLIATGHNNVGLMHTILGEYEKAMEHQLQCLDIRRRTGNLAGQASACNNLGLIAFRLDDFPTALDYFQKAVGLYGQSQAQGAIMRALGNIASVYRKMGRYTEARGVFLELLKRSQDLGDRISQATYFFNLGEIEEALGDFPQARSYLGQALAITEELEIHDNRVIAHVGLARLERLIGNPKAALKHIKQGLEMAIEEDSRNATMKAQEEAAQVYAALGDYQQAFQAHQQFHDLDHELGSQEVEQNLDKLEQQYKAREKEQQIKLLQQDNQLQTAKAAEEAREMELTMVKKDNTIKQLDLQRQQIYQVASLLLLAAAVAFFVFYLRSQRKTLLQERTLNKKLKQLDSLKDEFLANTSHELRTPLTGIVGLAEALMHKASDQLPQDAHTDLAMIAASGKRLTLLVNDLLDFSKLKNHQLELHQQQVNLEALTEVVVHISKRLAPPGVQLINAVPKDLPIVAADENRLQQILFNLVGNAVKFTAKGSITVSAEVENRQVIISVADTGIGISPENLQSIFLAFEQGEGCIDRVQGGTGLGLAISKRLVGLHGGEIRVSSTVNQGSVFSFNLPLADAATPAVSAQDLTAPAELLGGLIDTMEEHHAPVQAAVTTGEHQAHVLIVDDEAVNRRVLRHHLSQLDVKVTEAANGEQALALIQEHRFDLVLLDIMMPQLSGYQVCKRLRQKFSPQALPVVFLSAKNRVVDLVEGFHCGANDYLVKPFLKAELLARVQVHLDLVASHGAVERLRGQIAQDLHDEVGGLLTQISLQAEWMQIVPGLADKVKTKAAKMGQAARTVVKSFRDVIWSLDARNDTSEQLLHRIREVATELLEHNPECEYEVVSSNLPTGVSPEKRRNIFLICKEALNNIAKHADATKIRISLENNPSCFKLSIRDNGKGFAQEQPGSGLGLRSMQLRALSLGGQLKVLSESGVDIEMECQSLMVA